MTCIPDIIDKVRTLELDHAPDGYPAITMDDCSKLATAAEKVVPALDILQEKIETGHVISHESNRFVLRSKDNEWYCSGKSIRELIVNLIFMEC